MKFEIEADAFDDIFRALVVEDWKQVKQEFKRLKNIPEPMPHQIEDLKYYKKLKKSYERIIRYTHASMEAEEILGKKEKIRG